MQIWFARAGEVPLRDQLATQLLLAIVSGELSPGKRLPSTRALARVFKLNANTVSAAYKQLEDLGLVESVRGSGVYVRAQHHQDIQRDALNALVVPFLRASQAAGFSRQEIKDRVDYWLAMRPKQFVFVHPDGDLRALVKLELQRKLSWPVEGCRPESATIAPYLNDSIFLTVPSKELLVRTLLPETADVVTVEIRPVSNALSKYLPIPPDALVVVASVWPQFLRTARTVLIAAGCNGDSVVSLDARQRGWQRKIDAASVVVCDVIASEHVPSGVYKVVFALMSETTVARLVDAERSFAP